MNGQILALAATMTGTAGALTAAAAEDPMGIGPYVGGGAGVIAVAALAEVTRRLLSGRLIPRETRDAEAEMSAYIVAAGQREAEAMRLSEKVIKLAEDSSGMVVNTADALKRHTEETAVELAKVTARQSEQVVQGLSQVVRATDDLRDELRELRRGGKP